MGTHGCSKRLRRVHSWIGHSSGFGPQFCARPTHGRAPVVGERYVGKRVAEGRTIGSPRYTNSVSPRNREVLTGLSKVRIRLLWNCRVLGGLLFCVRE